MEKFLRLVRSVWFSAALSALAAFLVFLPVLDAKFVWDDSILAFRQLPYLTSAGDAFLPPKGIAQWSLDYYRPVTVLSYIAEQQIVKARSSGPHDPNATRIPHTTSLLLHALAAGAVTLLAGRALRNRASPASPAPPETAAALGTLAAGLFFALHPVHSETVCTIAGRTDSLATLFLVSALLLALHGRDKKSLPATLGAAGLFLLALLSKEVALAGLVLLPLCLWLIPGEGNEEKAEAPNVKSLWVAEAAFLAVAAFYGALRLWAEVGVGQPSSRGAAEQAGRALGAAAFYLRKVFLPWPPQHYVAELPGPAEIAVALAFAAILAYAAWRLYRRGQPLYLLCLAWFALTCAPALALAVRVMSSTTAAERYLYLPSVGLALAVGGLVAASYGTRLLRNAALVCTTAVLVIFGAACRQATAAWQNDLKFWTEITGQPSSARYALPWVNLGMSQMRYGDVNEAQEAFRRALGADILGNAKDRSLALSGLGNIDFNRAREPFQAGRLEEATQLLLESENYYAQAVAVAGDQPDWSFLCSLGKARLQRAIVERDRYGRLNRDLVQTARNDLLRALEISPDNPEPLRFLQLADEVEKQQ